MIKLFPTKSILPLITNKSCYGSLRFVRSISKSPKPVTLSHKLWEPKEQNDEKIPLIVLHGLFGSKENFSSLAREWSQVHNHPVVTADIRNHGMSEHSESMSFEDMADDVCSLLTELNFSKYNLIGHSLGGKVVMMLALRNPEVVNKMVVLDIWPVKSAMEEETLGTLGRPLEYLEAMLTCIFDQNKSLSQNRKSIINQLMPTVENEFLCSWLAMNVIQDATSKQIKWRMNLPIIRSNMSLLSQSINYFDHTPSQIETLFLLGGQSLHTCLPETMHRESYARTRAIFPQAEKIVVKKASHWIHSDSPKETSAEVIKFLNS